jgi:hypothetical protein
MDTAELTPAQREEQKLKRLQEKIAKLNAQKQRLMARNSKRARKDDTRRKVIIGGIVQAEAAKTERTRDWLNDKLKREVLERDRYLFPELWPDAQQAQEKNVEKEAVQQTS